MQQRSAPAVTVAATLTVDRFCEQGGGARSRGGPGLVQRDPVPDARRSGGGGGEGLAGLAVVQQPPTGGADSDASAASLAAAAGNPHDPFRGWGSLPR